MFLKEIGNYRLITLSVYISQFYVAHRAGPDGEKMGPVVYRTFATGETKVHVMDEVPCCTITATKLFHNYIRQNIAEFGRHEAHWYLFAQINGCSTASYLGIYLVPKYQEISDTHNLKI